MLRKLLELLIGKDIGGRLFLTYVSGLCFAYMVITKVYDEKGMMVIIMVWTLYFSRNDRNQNKEVTK
jgi:hypothetical protein